MTKLSKLIGQILDGKYQLDKLLGQGGMGAVYLATHLGTRRPVALKVIAPQFMSNTEFVERFRREAEAAGRLRHPNVVNVTDFGFAQIGREQMAYLVMEYLDGGSLGDRLKEYGKLPITLVTDILEQICLAVGNAHKLGVIHRDLKPDNIWLQPDGRGGYIAKVLDFGLAKLRDRNDIEQDEGAQSGSGAITQVTNRNTDSLKEAETTTRQGGRTDVHTRLPGALTAVSADEQTGLMNRPETRVPTPKEATHIQTGSASENEGATLIQPNQAADTGINEGATLLQPHAPNSAQINEDATRIQPTALNEDATRVQPAAYAEDATHIQPAFPDDESEGATRIQPAIVSDDEEGATRIQPAIMNDDEGATRIQPVTVDDDEGATRIQSFTDSQGNPGNLSSPSSPSVSQRHSKAPAASVASSGMRSQSLTGGASHASSSNLSVNSLSTTTSSVELTRVGSIMGTPLYMSPEQCRSEALDARSDIYSLGVIVYQALAGEAPFRGDMTELIRKHCEDMPPPLKEKRTEVPTALSDLVTMSLAKNPADRPQTAEAFASAFRATAEGEPQILRAAKAQYYTAQRVFFLLSVLIYGLFAVVTFIAGSKLSPWLVNSRRATLAFYTGLYVCILFATRLSMAASTFAVSELRRKSSATVSPLQIVKAVARRLPALAATTLQSLGRVLLGFAKLILPGPRTYIDHALAPSVVMIEGLSGAAALDRSRQLIGRLRTIAAALLARDFGIGLSSLLLFPAITVIMATVFGGSRADAFAAMMVPTFRNFIVIYSWFLLVIMHGVYSAVPMAILYFKAREATGEWLDEKSTRDWQAEAGKRPGRMSRASMVWGIAPILMLALMALSSVTSFNFGSDALIESVHKGDRQTIVNKLAAGANPNANRLTTTVLMYAAKDGQAEITSDLLKAGATVDTKDNDGDTALVYAAIDNRVEVAKTLIAAGANVNTQNYNADTPLIAAALRGRTEMVRLLLAAGADANIKNQKNDTPLSLAEASGHTDIVEMLKNPPTKN